MLFVHKNDAHLYVELIKGSLSIILSDPPYEDGNTLFTKVPLKPLSDQQCGRYCGLKGLKVFIFNNSDMSSCSRNSLL